MGSGFGKIDYKKSNETSNFQECLLHICILVVERHFSQQACLLCAIQTESILGLFRATSNMLLSSAHELSKV